MRLVNYVIVGTALLLVAFQTCAAERENSLILSCKADNDLYRTLQENKIVCSRYNTPGEAIDHAGEGSGVLILADGYPAKTTALDAALFQKAAGKKLRLYVEYPSFLPDTELGAITYLKTGPYGAVLERTVVASDAFGSELPKLRIMMIHDCHYLPVAAANPHLVLARVSGFDTARFGLPAAAVHPILFEHPRGEILVSVTKLSQFVTARYAPTDAWGPVWQMILGWLQPGKAVPALKWTPTVRPVYGPGEALPPDFEKQTIQRGAEWFVKSRLLVHPSWQEHYDRPSNKGPPTKDWPLGHRIGLRPDPSWAIGDGSLGMLEGFGSRILCDGSQAVLWWRRHDNSGEIAGAMTMAGVLLQDERFRQIGGNLGDWLYGQSLMTRGDRADPKNGAFGLAGWNDVPRYYGNTHGYDVYYADDNARGMLGMIKAAAALKTDRWDERLAQCLLANLRITSRLGFSPERIDGPLPPDHWRSRFQSQFTFYCPHHQAYLQACYLWAYRQTGDRLFLDRARSAIRLTMEAYPGRWTWTNGQITLERARFLLPLAWLVRVEDTPEHRAWLDRMVKDLLTDQVECGAIRTRIVRSPASNEAYGTAETALVDQNGDPVSDLLYESNFALVGLREASAATGNAEYRKAEDKLAEYICRIQARSETHPELDGVWYRGFDFQRWQYWAADADVGWSLWSTETGWTQAEILSTLVLRQLNTSLWEYTAASKISRPLAAWRRRMLPDEASPAREPINLSGNWSFQADRRNEGETAGWFADNHDVKSWRDVTVPVAFDNCGPDMDRYTGVGTRSGHPPALCGSGIAQGWFGGVQGGPDILDRFHACIVRAWRFGAGCREALEGGCMKVRVCEEVETDQLNEIAVVGGLSGTIPKMDVCPIMGKTVETGVRF